MPKIRAKPPPTLSSSNRKIIISNHGRLPVGFSGEVLAAELGGWVTDFPEIYSDHRKIIVKIE
jgi:hypothetical protein